MDKSLERLNKELDNYAANAEKQRREISAELDDCKRQVARYDRDLQDAAEAGDINAHTAAFSAKAYYSQRAEVLKNAEITEVTLTAADFNKLGVRIDKEVTPVFSEKLKATVAAYNTLCRQFEELQAMAEDYANAVDRANGMAGIARGSIPASHPCAPGYHDPGRYMDALTVYRRYILRAAEDIATMTTL